jgi:phosphate transport system substrate-binding protein
VGLGGKGNEGVAGLIKQTPYSLGYVELVYALQNNMAYGAVRNAAGVFQKATLQSVSAAAASVAGSMPDDFRVSITNPSSPDAYPIASFTWLLVPSRIEDPVKREAIRGFLAWMLSAGQAYAEPLAYARIPQQVIEKEIQAIALIQ